MKVVKVIVLSVVAIYFAVNLYAYTIQSQLIYYPTVDRLTPQDVGLVDVYEVVLETESGMEFTSWYGLARSGRPTILFFHGNGGAVSHRDYRFRQLMAEGYGVLVLGYPGYGGNDGEPSERSFAETSLLSYEYLRGLGVDSGDIVIYGESLGSGVAVQLAAKVQAKALILEAPMTSTIDVARKHYPLLLAGFLLRDAFASIDLIDRVGMPLLVMHGDNDAMIPLQLGRKLFERAMEPKKFVALKGAGHNDLQLYPVGTLARDFIDSH